MKLLFNIVKDRPIEEDVSKDPICPYCSNDKDNIITTLLGFSGDTNPNHTWTNYTCNNCNKYFCRETKNGNVWYTNNGKVLKGIPNCSERYIYTCIKCNGGVVRKYTELDGVTKLLILTKCHKNGIWKQKYRTFFNCKECNHGGEVKDYYYYPPRELQQLEFDFGELQQLEFDFGDKS